MKAKVYHLANFKLIKLTSIFLLILLASCDEHFNREDLYGLYVPISYTHSYDTIQLKTDDTYSRRVYNANRKLVLKMSGKWTLIRQHIINFNSFFLNYDDDLIKFPELVKDTSAEWQVTLETKDREIQFCIGNHKGQGCYKKLK